MHHFIKSTLTVVFTLAAVSAAKADPAEITAPTLTRTAADGLTLQAQLQKNITRTESYQANYDVQVPYQDTESYTDYETYYENEYQCHNEMDWERQCRTETQCGYSEKLDIQVPFGIDRVVVVWPPGGGGGGGEPAQPPPPPPQPTCHERQVCDSVPVNRNRCGYEQVSRTRPVTRYRTVTNYRTETRCCVTKNHEVFDHQWITQVSIQFPAGTELLANEQETFKLVLQGSEGAADVKLTPATTIFGYQIASKQVNGNSIAIVLAQTPRYKAADLGPATLQKVTMGVVASGVNLSFLDDALFPRTATQYQVIVAEAATQTPVATSELIVAQQRQFSLNMQFAWDPTKLYEVTINVHREGASVIDTGVVDFQIKKVISLTVDQAALKLDKNIGNASVVGTADQAVVSFTDLTLPYADVKTDYVITLVKGASSLGSKTINRAALSTAADGSMSLKITDFGLKPASLALIKPGLSMKVVVEVRRTQKGKSMIQFWKDLPVVVQ